MYEPPEDVVAFISSYMNESQPEALVEIARGRGAAADHAQIVGMTSTQLTLRVTCAGEETEVRLDWPGPLRRREDIRAYLQEMQEDARFA